MLKQYGVGATLTPKTIRSVGVSFSLEERHGTGFLVTPEKVTLA